MRDQETLKFFFIAGEASGDAHAVELIASLRKRFSSVAFSGLGGPAMHALEQDIEDWTEEAAVLGLWEVLKKYGYFKRRFNEMLRRLRAEPIDAVVLVDYPGFNLRLAKALRDAGFPGKIIYYISPQVWAWNRGRIPKMAKWLDLMLCIFPFEVSLYEASGLRAVFVGHPLVDELAHVPRQAREEGLVGLFPGSRRREVEKLFGILLDSARLVADAHAGIRFAAAAATPRLAALMRAQVQASGLEVEVTLGGAHALMQRATVGVVASGTATLEAAFFGLPYCLVYSVAAPTYVFGRMLIKVPFLGIVNILAGRAVVKELIQHDARADRIATETQRLLYDGELREALKESLREAVEQLGGAGTHERAAAAIMEELQS